MVNQIIVIGIAIGVFFAGLGVGYAALQSTVPATPMMTQKQMQQMMNDPNMMNQWHQTMMQNPQAMNQWMGTMMNDQQFMQQMHNSMMNDPQHMQTMTSMMGTDMMGHMMNNPQMNQHMMNTMMGNQQFMHGMMMNPQFQQNWMGPWMNNSTNWNNMMGSDWMNQGMMGNNMMGSGMMMGGHMMSSGMMQQGMMSSQSSQTIPTDTEPQTRTFQISMEEVEFYAEVENEGGEEAIAFVELHTWKPNTIIVNQGDTVVLEITNPRKHAHTLSIPAFNVNSEMLEPRVGSDTVTFVADTPGVFTFYCGLPYNPDKLYCDPDHNMMTGTLIVLE